MNSYKKEKENYPLVKKQLPREQKQHYLYEINIDDDVYQNEYRSFDHFLSNPDIENIYEQDIPLLFRFITEIGAMCKIAKTQTKGASQNQNKVFLFE